MYIDIAFINWAGGSGLNVQGEDPLKAAPNYHVSLNFGTPPWLFLTEMSDTYRTFQLM